MENLCIFYASKYHLSVVLLEYLKNKNTEKYTVQTFLQNKITDEIKTLMDKYEIKIKSTNEVNFGRTEDIKNKKIELRSNMIFIIEGDSKYMKESQNYIKELIKNQKIENVKIINCYDFENQIEKMTDEIKNNSKILYTSGVKTID